MSWLRLGGGSSAEPDELLCSICFTLFRDPVVTSRGFTYERSAILAFWRSPACAEGPRDPQSGNVLVEDKLVPNWEVRRIVEKFLRDNPGYTPQGWPDHELPPPARDLETTWTDGELPDGFRVGDIVVSLVDRSLAGGEQLQKGEVGRVVGPAPLENSHGIRCLFWALGPVTVQAAEITPRNLPGGYRVGDAVVSLIDHASAGQRLRRGDVGRVVRRARAEAERRLTVDFFAMKGLDICLEQICPEELPGGYRLDDEVISLIDHSPDGGLHLAIGDAGRVVGQASVDSRRRLKVDFPCMPGVDICPEQIAPRELPGGHRVGDRVVSLIDYASAGCSLKKGDVGIVAGHALRDPARRLRVDFPDYPGMDIFPVQVQPV